MSFFLSSFSSVRESFVCSSTRDAIFCLFLCTMVWSVFLHLFLLYAPNLFVFRLASIIFIRCDSIESVVFFSLFAFAISRFFSILVAFRSDKNSEWFVRGNCDFRQNSSPTSIPFYSIRQLRVFILTIWGKERASRQAAARYSIILNYHLIQKLIPLKQPVSDRRIKVQSSTPFIFNFVCCFNFESFFFFSFSQHNDVSRMETRWKDWHSNWLRKSKEKRKLCAHNPKSAPSSVSKFKCGLKSYGKCLEEKKKLKKITDFYWAIHRSIRNAHNIVAHWHTLECTLWV